MENTPETVLSQYERKNIDLLNQSIEKTLDGKIKWRKVPSGIFASIPGVLQMNFVAALSPRPPFLAMFAPEAWESFSVSDHQGNLLTEIQNQGVIPSVVSGKADLLFAVTKLFNLVITQIIGELDKAITLVREI